MKQFSLWIPLLSSVCTQPFFHAKTKVPGFCHSFISSCLTCYGLDLEKIPLPAGLWYLPYQFQSYVVLFQIAETAFCFPRFFFFSLYEKCKSVGFLLYRCAFSGLGSLLLRSSFHNLMDLGMTLPKKSWELCMVPLFWWAKWTVPVQQFLVIVPRWWAGCIKLGRMT